MKSFIARKDKIIITSINILSELGIHALTVQELAIQEQMAQSLIYKYFKSIDDIIIYIIDYYSKYDNSIILSTNKKGLSHPSSILEYFRCYIEYYENYPQISCLVNGYEALKNNPIAKTKMEDILKNRSESLMSLVTSAQTQGKMGDNLSAYEISTILWGTVMHLVQDWRIKKYSYSLKEKVMSTLERLLKIL